MNLQLSNDQSVLKDAFEKLFLKECTPKRVRTAEPLGFDPELWQQLVAMGLPLTRVPETAEGAGLGLLEAAIISELGGNFLVPAPIIETLVSSRLLHSVAREKCGEWCEAQTQGKAIISLVLHEITNTSSNQIVSAGAIADAVIGLHDGQLILFDGGPYPALDNLGNAPTAAWRFDAGNRVILATGDRAIKLFQGAVEEWKLLTAAALTGMASRALKMAAAYSNERKAFGRLIGSYQGLAHPMAEAITDIEGSRLLVWHAVCLIANRQNDAAAGVSAAYWWANRASSNAIAKALHLYGGYGLSLEYDIQLYFRRVKGWPLVYGDPGEELELLTQRLWDYEIEQELPPTGPVALDFDYGPNAEALAEKTRKFFAENLTEELRKKAYPSWEGHHPEMQKKLAEAGLLYPDWAKAYGGQGCNSYAMVAVAKVFHQFGWSRAAIGVTDMVGKVILKFGSDVAKSEILPLITSGEQVCCLGYTEPSCGSDVFAATTRAVKSGNHWIINGQKIFTSGANIADYVLLLTRTDPDAPKHAGLTLFIVPLKSPGIEVRPIHTLADERTNVVFYHNVTVPEKYRIGAINGGVEVMAASLSQEQDGYMFAWNQQAMVDRAVAWARSNQRGNKPAIEHPAVRLRLAKAWINARVADLLSRRSLWSSAEGLNDRSAGPMSKLFATDNYIRDSADLLDLMAPNAIIRDTTRLYTVELDYRWSTAASIYGGSAEIMRSLVAEHALNMPRSRS